MLFINNTAVQQALIRGLPREPTSGAISRLSAEDPELASGLSIQQKALIQDYPYFQYRL